jgi:hypothetical protein
MGALDSLEGRIEDLIEGTSLRVFRSHVQPVDLVARLQRAMRASRLTSRGRSFAHNYYKVWLSPHDYKELEPSRAFLEVDELPTQLKACARRDSLMLITPPRVRLVAHQSVPLGSVRVTSWLQVEGERALEASDDSVWRQWPFPERRRARWRLTAARVSVALALGLGLVMLITRPPDLANVITSQLLSAQQAVTRHAAVPDKPRRAIPLWVRTLPRRGATLRVRPAPGSRVLLTIPAGSKVLARKKPIGRRGGDKWYRVTYRGRSGYVLASLLTTEPPQRASRPSPRARDQGLWHQRSP